MPRFSELLMEHFQSPRNRGGLPQPDLIGQAGVPGQGPFVSLTLQLDGERITAARFECNGCGVTVACSSILTELIQGRTIAECAALTAADVADELGGIPPDKGHCPGLAIEALHNALAAALVGGAR